MPNKSVVKSIRPLSRLRWSFACGAALLICSQAAQADFALKPNDRVVFYGDSITEQKLYTTFVEAYVLTRFPKLPVTFVHSGWGGDRVSGGGGGPIDLRLKRDVLAYKPTVMTIMLGMNDAAYRAFDQGIYNNYTTGYDHILDVVKKEAPGIRLTLIQPSPYDDVTQAPGFDGGYNAVLRRYGDYIKTTATANNATVADLNTNVVSMLQKANTIDAKGARELIKDRVHPGPGGHLIMAEELLKAWGAPSLVSAVSIDATGGKVTRAENSKVSDLKTGPALTWTQTDEALPFPLDPNDAAIALAVKASDFTEALNRQPLQVTGLTAPRYTLTIDGDEVGDFSREELEAGVNLAMLPTPMLAQSQTVRRLTLKHNDQHSWRWRNIQVPLESHSEEAQKASKPLLKALDDEEAKTVEEQRKAAQPKPHRFELTATAADDEGPNLALKKPYVASDPNVFNYGIGNLTNGIWEGNDQQPFASGDKDTFPKTVTIDLGEASRISRVRLGVPPFGSTKTIKVSVSADGENFTEVGSHTFDFALDRRRSFKFAPTTARFVRLTYPDHYTESAGYSPNFSFTSEVEVYGPKG